MSEALARMRVNAIAVLKRLYRNAQTDAERRAVNDALSAATATPHSVPYSNELLRTILENTYDIVEFYGQIANSQSYEVLQHLEHKVFFLYRRNQALPADAAADPQISNIRDRLTQKILAFRDGINIDRIFVIYKILVGFEFVFPPAWQDPDLNYREGEIYRERGLPVWSQR